jgi:uncharacterized membrane protein YeaQ/YmgE (transglycosylase-associated protein family)
VTILIGIVGAFVGGWIGSYLGWGTVDEFSFRTLLLAIGGSFLVLVIYAALRRKH